MIKEILVCDICGREVTNRKELYTVKVKSNAFIEYHNFDILGADKRKFDICSKCVENFKEFTKENIFKNVYK